MLNDKNIFGDFSDQAIIEGMCLLVTQTTHSLLQYHTAKNNDFRNILNPHANQNILKNIQCDLFGDFSEDSLAQGIDKLIDMILKEYLFYYSKSKTLNPSIFGDFSEEAIINVVNKIINERIINSFQSLPSSNQSKSQNQTTYNSTKANQYVYILYNDVLYSEYSTHIYKIGWTSRTPEIRAVEISQGTGVVGNWKVGHQWKVEDGYWLEQKIFKHFSQYRLPYSEQFNFKGQTIEQVAEQISRFINNYGESPKRATEIAEKQRQQELQRAEITYQEQLRKLEAEKSYNAKCKSIKTEISLEIHTLMQNEMKIIHDKRAKINIWYYIVTGFIVIPWAIEDSNFWIKGLTGGCFITLIVGFILSKIFKDKTQENSIKEKYSKYNNLPDDPEKLNKIKNEIFYK